VTLPESHPRDTWSPDVAPPPLRLLPRSPGQVGPRIGPSSSGRADSTLRLLGDAFAARLLLAAFALVSTVVVAHRVRVGVYGVYATATAFAALLSGFTDLGSSAVVVRDGAREADRIPVARTYLHVRISLIALTCVVGALLVPVTFPGPAQAAAYLALLTILFSGAPLIAPLGQLYGTMRPFRVAAMMQGGATLTATLGAVIVFGQPNARILVLANGAGAVIGTCTAARLSMHWTGNLLTAVDWPRARRMIRAISVLGLAAVVTAAYAKIDSVLLLDLRGSHAAGLYAAAARLLDQTTMVPVAILVPISPVIARAFASNAKLPQALDVALRRIETGSGIALALGTIGVAYWATLIILGTKYRETASLLAILAVAQSWIVVAYVATAKVVHARLERQYVLVTICGLILNVGCNLILIPAYAAYGAAYATLVTEFMTVVAYCWVGRSVTAAPRWRTLGAQIAVSGVACALFLESVRSAIWIRGCVSAALISAAVACGAVGVRSLRSSLGPQQGPEESVSPVS
jgi:O-antigen/teichoic acid export membrane protein